MDFIFSTYCYNQNIKAETFKDITLKEAAFPCPPISDRGALGCLFFEGGILPDIHLNQFVVLFM